jgi:hypothetical protein
MALLKLLPDGRAAGGCVAEELSCEQQSVSGFRYDWPQKLAVPFILRCESILQEVCRSDTVHVPENSLRGVWRCLKLYGLQR